ERIKVGCGIVPTEVLSYIETGAVPVNMTGPNVLLRNCPGGNGAVQTLLSLAGRPAMTSNLKACIVDAFAPPRAPAKQACTNDPRAVPVDQPIDDTGGASTDVPPACRVNSSTRECIEALLGLQAVSEEARQVINRVQSLVRRYNALTVGITLSEERATQL